MKTIVTVLFASLMSLSAFAENDRVDTLWAFGATKAEARVAAMAKATKRCGGTKPVDYNYMYRPMNDGRVLVNMEYRCR